MSAAGSRRRNGKLSACEPCRRGKLACDHGTPHCGRCVRRKTTATCIYHPAPMTRTQTSNSSSPVKNFVTTSPASTSQSGSAGQQSLGSQQFVNTTSEAMDLELPGQPKPGWKDRVFRRSSRFYGETSFSAVFTESKTKPEGCLLDIGEDSRKHPGAWVFGEPLLGRLRPSAPSVRESQTVKALWNIPPKDICESLLKHAPFGAASLEPTMIKHTVLTLWSTFEAALSEPRSDEGLKQISDVLFKNEETPLPASDDQEGMPWLGTFTGPNLRFEILGLLFCFFGMAYLSLQDSDPRFKLPENEGRDRNQTSWRMKECADVCIQMCYCSETVNYLVAALLLQLKRLESGCTGDETFTMRRLSSDMVTIAISSGLHRLPGYDSAKFSASLEYKRRLFCEIYANDKTNASLNGVPPLLTQHFCQLTPCLDLPTEALYYSQAEFEQALTQVDENGWNNSGNIQETSILRSRFGLALIREEVLELALGVNVDISEARISNLHLRSRQLYESFPPKLQYHGGTNPTESTGSLLFEQAYKYLSYMQNRFLIDRLATARGLPNEQGLLETSINILDTSLMYWMQRDQLMDYSYHFDWIVTYYGIPSAGVLCIALLKASAGQSTINFSRSNAIQKLTLFIGFLDWIRPTDGNYHLAQRLRKVVRRVLDYVLEPTPKEQLPSTEVPFDFTPVGFEDMGDNLDWINTIDWTQGSWIDLN